MNHSLDSRNNEYLSHHIISASLGVVCEFSPFARAQGNQKSKIFGWDECPLSFGPQRGNPLDFKTESVIQQGLILS